MNCLLFSFRKNNSYQNHVENFTRCNLSPLWDFIGEIIGIDETFP